MQNRRHFLIKGFSLAAAGLAGATAFTRARRTLADEAPPETTSLRLGQYPATCLAPLFILDDLLHDEGFADVRYVPFPTPFAGSIARGEADFGQDFIPPTITPIEAGVPMVMLAGVHLSCYQLFAHESVGSVGDLKGNGVGVFAREVGDGGFVLLSIIAASVGLDPAKDINWVALGPRDQTASFASGEIDAFITFPPWAQELRARNVGHVILDAALDRPWSQYLCCVLIGASDFVHRNPIATKRVVRAMVRANDICVAKPDWVARRLVDRGFAPGYDSVRQGLDDVSYRNWRDYDVEDSVRFWALRLRELGMIKSSPDKILATGTDRRFIKEVRKELGI